MRLPSMPLAFWSPPHSSTARSVALLALSACATTTIVYPLSPQAKGVRVEENDPPASATSLGPIAVVNGKGCNIFDAEMGTLEGATAALKEAAARQGADFVKVTKIVKPYSGHDCYHREFRMEGVSYRLKRAAVTPTSNVPVPVQDAACDPPCSPGYACEVGVCRALCNPACSAGQICRVDRVCVPATP